MNRFFAWVKKGIIFFGVATFVLSILLPPVAGLTVRGQRSLGLFFLTVSFWITGSPIPPAVTGLMILGLVPILGILPANQTFALFGNRAVFFILGAFMLSAGLMKSGLARRISVNMLYLFKGSPYRIALGIFLTSDILAYFMPAHAVAALIFPVVMRLVHDLHLSREHRRYEAILFLAMAWGSVIGGIATPLGGARAPLAIGMLQEEFGIAIQFFKWTIMATPLSIAISLFGALYLFLLTKNSTFGSRQVSKLNSLSPDLSPMTANERKMLWTFVGALFLWVFFNKYVDMAVVAILAAGTLFLVHVVNWRDVEDYVNWGVILMYGGAIVLGRTLTESGGADWLSTHLLLPLASTPFRAFIVFAIVAIVLTEAMSNVATVAFLLPIIYSIVGHVEMSPFFATLTVALPSGLAFMLPVGTPPNAIAYSSGRYSIAYGVRRGLPFVFVSIVLLVIVARFLWPLMGIHF